MHRVHRWQCYDGSLPGWMSALYQGEYSALIEALCLLASATTALIAASSAPHDITLRPNSQQSRFSCWLATLPAAVSAAQLELSAAICS